MSPDEINRASHERIAEIRRRVATRRELRIPQGGDAYGEAAREVEYLLSLLDSPPPETPERIKAEAFQWARNYCWRNRVAFESPPLTMNDLIAAFMAGKRGEIETSEHKEHPRCWYANFIGYEPGDLLGRGPTEGTAVADLLKRVAEEDGLLEPSEQTGETHE